MSWLWEVTGIAAAEGDGVTNVRTVTVEVERLLLVSVAVDMLARRA